MSAVLVAASYSRIGFNICLAIRARRVRVPGGSSFHLETGTINHMHLERAWLSNYMLILITQIICLIGGLTQAYLCM